MNATSTVRCGTMVRLPRNTFWIVIGLLFTLVSLHRSGPLAADAQPPGDKKPDAKKEMKLDINAVPENARKVEFTTDEGTWMSVDVSPDGRTILFDLLGDLYRIPIAGGQAERVTWG